MTAGFTVTVQILNGWTHSQNSKKILEAASVSKPTLSVVRHSTMIETSNGATRYERNSASLGKSKASTIGEERYSQADSWKQTIAIVLLVMKGLNRVAPAR